MSPTDVGVVSVLVVLLLMAFGLPVGTAMGLVGFAGLAYLLSFNAALVKTGVSLFATISNYSLAVLPLFVLMAQIVFVTGLSTDMFRAAQKWMGRLPGSVALASIGTCAAFSAVSASSIATAVTVGKVALPEMDERGYDRALSTGAIAAGGSLGILIPPSSILIIYGVMTETSIAKLFIGGIMPGVILTLLFMLSIGVRTLANPNLCPREQMPVSLREKVASLGSCWEMLGLIALVLGGLMIGWFTPTEAGAVGAVGAAAFSLFRRRLTLRNLGHSLIETGKTIGMIYLIMIGAFILNHLLAVSTLPTQMAKVVSDLPLPPLAIVGAMVLVWVVLGCFVDAMAIVLLTVPVFYPVAMNLGFDAIWFGIVIVIVVEMALITPPVGMNVYAISGIAKGVPMETIFRGIMPFLLMEVILLIALMILPDIVLFLPNLFK